MESFGKMITRVTNSVTSAVEKVQKIQAPVMTSIHGLADSLSSVDYDELRKRWGEYEDMDDLDDTDESYESGLPDEDVTPALNGEAVCTDKDGSSVDTTAKAV
jgi:hypothetical protein